MRIRRLVRLGALALLIAGGMGVAAAYLVPLPERLHARPSPVVEYRDGTFAHVFVAEDGRYRAPVRIPDLDPNYVKALLALEDQRFHVHPGVDPLAILRALGTNLWRGERVSGASTLTMQLVRVLEPRPRTYASKLIEALRAVQLELRLSKEEILTAYLQFVPYGRNYEGVETAALTYFGHSARSLSAAEIATLLAVPQSPSKRAPSGSNARRLTAARDEIARRLASAGALPLGKGDTSPERVLAEVFATPVPTTFRPVPRKAPHAAFWLRAQLPNQSRIRTTLDRGLQSLAERTLKAFRAELGPKGIHHGALVLAEHQTGKVAALVGNFDFWDEEHGGQIPSFAVPRSPGSALKPLVYALAIDRGLSGPDQLVPDVPVRFGTYAPRNFDGEYEGLVRLEDALSRSLNVPFINLLQQLGVETFLGSLRQQGVASISPEPSHYGLSAIVGGIEVTPLEVASVYATLARGGRALPLRWLEDEGAPAERISYSEGAAYLTRQALALRDRPDFPERRRLTGAPPHIHWKTGTSFGFRDAWAAGSNGRFTAVVWLGNLDNSSSVHLTGASAAGPILFDMLEALSDGSVPPNGDAVPGELARIEVCAFSGFLATDACEHRRWSWARRSAVPTRTCPYHRKLDVDRHTGELLTARCRASHDYETRNVLWLPATVRRYFRDAHRALPALPPYAEGCGASPSTEPPTIVSPVAGQVALLIPGVAPEDQEVPLEAESSAQGALSWFVDGELLGTAPADERLWWKPTPGEHEIVVTNAAGLSSRRKLAVRMR